MGAIFQLPEEIVIHSIDQITNELGQYLAGTEELLLDGKNVSKIDACGLQILFSAYKEAIQKGKTFEFQNNSPYLTKVLGLIGAEKIMPLGGEE